MPLVHDPPFTVISIAGIDLSDYAVRSLTMTLTPIEQASNVARDCLGQLVDISLAQFRQHKLTISCTDNDAPELDGIWPGMDIAVTCLPRMNGTSDTPLTILAKVVSWNTSRDEWGAEIAWQIEAEQRLI
jgi:hypothetical protein